MTISKMYGTAVKNFGKTFLSWRCSSPSFEIHSCFRAVKTSGRPTGKFLVTSRPYPPSIKSFVISLHRFRPQHPALHRRCKPQIWLQSLRLHQQQRPVQQRNA